MRRLLVILLSAVGIAGLAVVQTMAYAGGNLLFADRFAESVSAALRTQAGADALARVVVDDLSARAERSGVALPASVQLQIGAVVAGLARSGAFGGPLEPALARAHDGVLEGNERVTVPLGAVRPRMVEAVARVAPGAAALVPPADDFPVLSVPVGSEVQRVGQALDTVRDLTRWAAPVAVASLLLALLAAPRRDRYLRHLGLAVLLLALLPLAVRGALRASAATASARDEALARAVADAVCDGWVMAIVLTAALGAALLIASVALGRR